MVTCPEGHAPSESGLADGYCDVCGNRLTGTAGAASAGVAPASAAGGSASSSPPPSAPFASPAGSGPPEECAACRAPVTGRFCEDCGHDQTAAPGQAGASATAWHASGSGPGSGPAGGNGPAGVPAPGQPGGTGPEGGRPESGAVSGRPGGNGAGSGPAAAWEATVQADRAHYDRMIAQGGPDSERVLFPPYCPRRDIPLAGTEVRIGRPSRSRNLVPEIDLSGPPEDPGVSHLHAVLLSGPGDGWTLIDPGSANGTAVNGRQIGINEPVPVGDGDRIHLGAWTLITLRRRRET
ncbi:FHA domain-containing protein [Planomonospora sp. ID67723]|uniref:FHA domain-containing protein n=1 Tax=Planomonospora sp. ID67723 TaxID=2738134 RepID=UPI0018C3BB89|nr:FHA domain-containing protein [Planomonospora sp. ID67723]MBG0829677.1 FHA domain-containing protein [Planomonospora sp. ID67723]